MISTNLQTTRFVRGGGAICRDRQTPPMNVYVSQYRQAPSISIDIHVPDEQVWPIDSLRLFAPNIHNHMVLFSWAPEGRRRVAKAEDEWRRKKKINK